MSQNISTIVRSNVLTNSAAEFIETRAQEALGAEVVSPSSPQYVPVRDQFMPKGEIPRYEERLKPEMLVLISMNYQVLSTMPSPQRNWCNLRRRYKSSLLP